jgi:flagellar motility protein MotE (MotC chaperone)
MDATQAAAIAQKLPVPYVAAVFAKMSADDAGPILAALPPAVAAKITQTTP